MSTKQGEILVKHTKDKITAQNEVKRLNKVLKETQDLLSGMTTQYEETQAKLDHWIKKQENGYCAVAITNGFITHAVNVLPYSKFTYTQGLPETISTALYRVFPYYELSEDGRIVENAEQLKKYKEAVR